MSVCEHGVNLAAWSCEKCDQPCLCLSYGHGLTATRVDVPYCPVHHPKAEARP